jgi:PAS domain S-box-containing protein/putative nucleotidyltransferase with HDIG domain
LSHTTTEKSLETEPREKQRIRAEKLPTAEGGKFDQFSPADVKNLVLELKMRQMQLEMQNEALQRAQEIITQARDRYADLYDFAPVGYFTLDRKGKIVEVNLAGAQLLGVERDLLVNQSSFRWVAPESREVCRTHYRKVFANQGPQTCEVKLRRRGGPPFYAALETVAAPGEAGAVLHCRTAMSDITLRKQAEIELKLKERLLDGASDSIFLHDLEGRFIYVNEAACRDRGYEREELGGKDVWALIPPDYAAIRGKILQDLLAQGEITFESVNIRKDRSVMPVEIHARIIDLGERRFVLSVTRDITDRKRAEETLLKEKTLSDTIINSLPGVFYFFDDTGRFRRWNCNFEKVTGYTAEEFAKLTPLDLFDGEDKTVIDQAIQEVFLRGENTAEANLLLKNGSKIPYFFTGRRIDLSGLPCIIGMGIDISDRQRAAEALRMAAFKWRTTFDAIGDALALMDQEGNILQCNKAMADLVGKPFPEIIGHRCWEVVHGTSGPIDNCPMARLRQFHQREESVLSVGENWFKVAVDPILDAAGNLTGAVHLIADITRIKRTEEKLLHSLGAAIQRQTEVTGLLEASRIVLSETSFETAVEDIYTLCKSLIGAAAGYVALFTAAGLEEQVIASDPGGLPDAVAAELPRLRREMPGEAHPLNRPVWQNDLAHSKWARLLPAGPPGLENVLFAPLQVGGKTVGVMGMFNKPGGFSEPEANLAAGFTEFAAIALVNMRARQALRQSEEKYRLLVNQVPAVVFKGYGDWSMDFFDQKVEALTGYSPEDFNTRKLKWKDLILPEDFIDTKRKFIETWKVDKSYEWEYRIRKRDGEIRWIQDLVQIFTDSAGKIDYVNGILFDITDRKQAEERLQRTSRALKALSACNQALVHATQEKDFLTNVCEVIVREGGYPLAWVGYAQSDQMKSVAPIASAGVEAENPEWIALTWGDGERGQGPGGMAIKTGEIRVARDILQDPALAPWHEEWRRRDFMAIIALPLMVEGKAIGILHISAQDSGAFDPEEVQLLEELAGGVAFGIWSLRTDQERQRAEAEVQRSLEKVKKALDGTVLAVANTMEMRDPYTAGHQRQVAQLAAAIAQEMGFPAERVEGMRVLGCLHDIGKIAIPAEILSKPGRLNRMEFTLIQDHPRVGYEIIKDIDFPFPLAEGILQHHERLNGSGYPQGIKEPDIILEARILGVADVVEAISSHRPYRKALGVKQALEEISRNRGILYDPEVVDICLKLFNEKGFSFSP